MLRSTMLRFASLGAAACVLTPTSGEAQHEPGSAEIARAVECFAEDVPPGRADDKNCSRSRLIGYLAPQQYPVAVAEQALDGLEELAVSSPDPEVRRYAVGSIGYVGSHPKTEVETIDRLTRIYRVNSSPRVVRAILDAASISTDSVRAANLLGEIATRTGEDPYHPSIPAAAVTRLHYMGETGQAVLTSLYDQDKVSDQGGAAMLRSFIATER